MPRVLLQDVCRRLVLDLSALDIRRLWSRQRLRQAKDSTAQSTTDAPFPSRPSSLPPRPSTERMNEAASDAGQCRSCYDLYGGAALPDNVKATSQICCICDLLTQVCLMHEASTGRRAGLLMFQRIRGLNGLKIVVVAAGDAVANTSYRLISVSQDISRLPFELPIRQIVNPAPSVDEIVQRVSFWLSWCDTNHQICGAIQQTRDNTAARLLQAGTALHPALSVVDFPGGQTRFAALSYCWGKAKQVKLTNDNIGQFRLAIPEDTLPQTIKDAIILTRELGIGYIWIDALCIIQDSAEDWNVEAGKMANVYGGAYVVISADRAQSCDSGFLGARSHPYEVLPIGVDVRNPEPMYAFLQRGNGADSGEWMHDFVLSGYRSEDRLAAACPVYSRGWCLQEQVLATRLVHFSDSEMVMECAEAIGCECEALTGENRQKCLPYNPPELPPKPRKPYWHQTRVIKSHKEVLDAWWSCVEQYSLRQLSVETDRLPAISGVAESLSECALGKYCAGIWEADLPSGFLWAVQQGFNANPRRPAEYTAPSWSWASVIGPVLRPDEPVPLPASCDTEGSSDNAGLLPTRAEVVDLECKPSSLSPFGSLVRASLTLKATVIALEARSISDQGTWHDYLELYSAANDRNDGAISIVPHYPLHSCGELDVFPSRESKELNTYLGTLALRGVLIDYNGQGKGAGRAHSFSALLVIPSSRENGAFERIGRVNLWIDGLWKRQALDLKEIVLV